MDAFGAYPAGRTRYSPWNRRMSCLAVALLLTTATRGRALDPGRAVTQYVHEIWTTDEGLPQDLINWILQTRDGYVWLATQEGLARFDGVRFTVFDKSNTPALPSDWISRILEARDGSLWVGTQTSGLCRYKDDRWTAFTTKEGLSGDLITGIFEDTQKTLWVCTDGKGLNRIEEGRKPEVYTIEHGLLHNDVRTVYRDSRGHLWVGTRRGLNLWKDGRFTVYSTEIGLAEDAVYSIVEDRSGGLWIGTINGGLKCLKGGTAFRLTTKDGLPNNSVLSLKEDREGNLWIGTDGGGLARLTEGRLTVFGTDDGLSHGVVNSIVEDHEGSLWIGTYGGGLDRLRDGSFTTYTVREGLAGNFAVSVFEDVEGAVWIGTFGAGLCRLKDGVVTTYTTKQGLSNDYILSVHGDRQGNLWIGTRGGGLNRLSDGRFSVYMTLDGVPCDNVWCLEEDGEGALWIGTDRGVSRYRDGVFTAYKGEDGFVKESVRAVFPDSEGNIWMGTFNAGLRVMKNDKVTTYTKEDGLPSNTIGAFLQDADGALWIGTESGVVRRKDGKFLAATGKDGLIDSAVWLILDDEIGNLWLGSNKGIFRFSKEAFADFAAGRIKRIRSSGYGKPDGMRSQECIGGAQPTGCRSRDGRLWFATTEGVAVVDPDEIGRRTSPPRVVVESLIADDELVSPKVSVLPPGKERLEFHYTALSFRIPSRVLFRYRLEGFDHDWVDAGTRRVVYYTNLPPGTYKFQVTACTDEGIWSETGASMAISLAPYFYQTRWFYALLVVALGTVIVAGYRLRVSRLHARRRQLELLVEERTVELRKEKEKTQQMNEKLQEAQHEITKLLESSPQALEDISRWGVAVADDIARIIGATEIGIWTLGRDGLSALNRSSRSSLSLDEVRAAALSRYPGGAEVIVPVSNIAGEICGALVVSGTGVSWGETEQRLVSGFAHQLGSTLQVQEMRRQLAEAHERRAATLKEMQDQGISTLQLCPSCGRCYDHTEENCRTDGARLETPRILPYRILDRYRLTHFMGQGGMGSVFGAVDERLERIVAIKIISAGLLRDPMMRSRVEREAHTLARLNHPGLIGLYDFGELPDGSAYLAMEFLQGLDLAEILRRQGPGTPLQVAAVLEQAGSALSSAHALGIIHRDLKPANLFLVPSGTAFQTKVVDFGLAKPPEVDKQLTVSGVMVGTPGYMSPEQVRALAVDERSDLFSFAAVAHELLTGKPAFGGGYIPEVLTRVMYEDPPPVSSMLRNAILEVDGAIAEAIQKDPARRPKSVAVWLDRMIPLLKEMVPEVAGWDLSVLHRTRGPEGPSEQITRVQPMT